MSIEPTNHRTRGLSSFLDSCRTVQALPGTPEADLSLSTRDRARTERTFRQKAARLSLKSLLVLSALTGAACDRVDTAKQELTAYAWKAYAEALEKERDELVAKGDLDAAQAKVFELSRIQPILRDQMKAEMERVEQSYPESVRGDSRGL